MAKYKGTTIAFSHKDRVWKTRYSFTPTCYAYVDNNMLSTNTNDDENKVHIWRHESDSTAKNRFYNEYRATTMTVVSNYNPSSVKLFKSISLESDVKNWSVNFFTNTNRNVDNQVSSLIQSDFSVIDDSVYSDIKPSRNKSISNTNLAFQIDGDILDNIPSQEELVEEVTIENPVFEFDVYISSQLGPFQVGDNCPILLLNSEGELVYLRGRNTITAENSGSFDEGYAVISAYDPINKIAKIKMDLSKSENNFNENNLFIPPVFYWQGLKPYIFIESPAEFNGDYMKGHFLVAEITCNEFIAMELFAININYEPTRLDHSLGQNV